VDPKDWRTLLEIGRAFLRARQYQEARRYLERAKTVDGSCPLLWYFLGRAEAELGMRDRALSSLQEALNLRPQFEDAREALERTARRSPGLDWLKRLFGGWASQGGVG
jgi:predicted Zn-dependent protease